MLPLHKTVDTLSHLIMWMLLSDNYYYSSNLWMPTNKKWNTRHFSGVIFSDGHLKCLRSITFWISEEAEHIMLPGLTLTFPFTWIKAQPKSINVQIGFPRDLHNSKETQLWVTDRLRFYALNYFTQRIKELTMWISFSPGRPPQNSIHFHSSLNPTMAGMIPLSAENNG